MDRIKSALEIAMERMEKQQRDEGEGTTFKEEEEYVKAAAILGRSYLQGKAGKKEIKEKLERYPEQRRAAALRAFIEVLTKNMTLNNTVPILEAIKYLRPDARAQDACAAAQKLYEQYHRRLAESLSLLEETAARFQQRKLYRAGIGGNAIAGFNVKGLEAWKEAQAQLEEEYAGVLESFRQAILEP